MAGFFQRFLNLAEQYPDHEVAIDRTGSYTYAELNRRSNLLAHSIAKELSSNAKSETHSGSARIALLLPRTKDYLVALLAVIRSGFTAIPVDTEYPAERIRYYLSDAQYDLIITHRLLLEQKGLSCEHRICWEDLTFNAGLEESIEHASDDQEGLILYTSGSTGHPKGVIHRQHIFTVQANLMSSYYTTHPKFRLCCITGLSFMGSMHDLTPALMFLGSVYIADEEERKDATLLHDLILKHRISGMFMPPKLYKTIKSLYQDCTLDYLIVGSEKFYSDKNDVDHLYEVYGSSEAGFSLIRTVHAKESSRRSIGKPAPNVRVYLVDKNGKQILHPGVTGELCLVSPYLAIGYNNKPEETSKKFVPCPFEDGTIMHHTGDYMQWGKKGDLLMIGRMDRMVKLHGYRIELEGVENVVRKLDGIDEVAVVVTKVNQKDKLACYYTVNDARRHHEEDTIREEVENFLPDYMVPDYFTELKVLPRNDRNKVDYLALQKLPVKDRVDRYVEPQSLLEENVCEACALALGVERFGATTDFFKAGGGSLTASILIANLSKQGYALAFRDILEHKTPRELALFLASSNRADEVFAMDRPSYPLTKTQMGIYLECLTGENPTTYTIPYVIEISPRVRAQEVVDAFQAVLRAHPNMKFVIRTTQEGTPCVFMRPDIEVKVPIHRGTEVERLSFMESFMPVIPLHESLFFHAVVYETTECCYLILRLHLICMDATSTSLFIAELNRALRGEELVSEQLGIQQVAMYEEHLSQTDAHDKAKRYFDTLFQDMPEVPSLKGDRQEKLTKGTSRNAHYKKKTLACSTVQKFCKDHKISENCFFNGVLALLLSKYLNAKRVSFSTVYRGRNLAGTENTIGTMIKRIPVFADFSKNLSVHTFLTGLAKQIFGTMSHDIYPFAEILKHYPVNDEVEFLYQSNLFTEKMGYTSDDDLAHGDASFVKNYHSSMVTGLLSMQFYASDGFYEMAIEYRNERFSTPWISRFMNRFFLLAKALLTQREIKSISLMTQEEKARIDAFNDTAVDISFVPVHEQIRAQARLHPNKIAVISNHNWLMFSDLDELSDRIAQGLIQAGVQRGDMVGVLLERDVYMYPTEIGILKTGGAFVPFTSVIPDERIEHCMQDASIEVLVTSSAFLASRPSLKDIFHRILILEELLATRGITVQKPVAVPVSANDLAYCIFTSGSTGKPKGVLIEHRGLANYIHVNEKAVETKYYTQDNRVCLALAAFSFDVSIVEEFIPLCHGNTVCIATDEEIRNPEALAHLIEAHNVTGMTCTPSYLSAIMEHPAMAQALKQITFYDIGAEGFPANLYEKLRRIRKDSVILNVYGPTECTLGCASAMMTSNRVHIGSPNANTKFKILDHFGNVLPIGIEGELVIFGDQVGRGYIHTPKRAKGAFFDWHGLPAYHTGDIAQWTSEGFVILSGRIDEQVKIRGYRIELPEIESYILRFDEVRSCAVLVHQLAQGERLAVFLTSSHSLDTSKLKAKLHEMVPDYMVPQDWVQLEELPLTANGKIDKKALAQMVPPSEERASEDTVVDDALQQRLLLTVQDLLGVSSLGVDDNLFELGLDSLKVIMLVNRLQDFGVSVSSVYSHQTVRSIASDCSKKDERSWMDWKSLDVSELREGFELNRFQKYLYDFHPEFKDSNGVNPYALYQLPNDVNLERFVQAINTAIQHHFVLRMQLVENGRGEPVMRFSPELFRPIVLETLSQADFEAIKPTLVQPFPTHGTLPYRIRVFKTEEGNYFFVHMMHVFVDGVSCVVFLKTLYCIYHGLELAPDFGFNHLKHQQTLKRDGTLEKCYQHFNEIYGSSDWTETPEQTACDTSNENACRSQELPSEYMPFIDRGLVSENELHIAVSLLTLSKCTGNNDILVRWAYTGRVDSKARNTMGFFLKELPLGVHMDSKMPLSTFIERIRSLISDGILHSDCFIYFPEEPLGSLKDLFCFLNQVMLSTTEYELDALFQRIELPDSPNPLQWGCRKIALFLCGADRTRELQLCYPKTRYNTDTMNSFFETYARLLKVTMQAIEDNRTIGFVLDAD